MTTNTSRTLRMATDFVVETCCACGMQFAIPADYQRRLRHIPTGKTRGQGFFCPAGHEQSYRGESEADKLRRERDRLVQREAFLVDQRRAAEAAAAHERARANGYKGHATKLAKRAKAGVCPCCNRHFSALERHMASQHPEFQTAPPEMVAA